jgi:hypothetical protein
MRIQEVTVFPDPYSSIQLSKLTVSFYWVPWRGEEDPGRDLWDIDGWRG